MTLNERETNDNPALEPEAPIDPEVKTQGQDTPDDDKEQENCMDIAAATGEEQLREWADNLPHLWSQSDTDSSIDYESRYENAERIRKESDRVARIAAKSLRERIVR